MYYDEEFNSDTLLSMAVGMVVGTIPGTMAMLVTTVGAGPIIVVGMAGAGTIPIGVVSTSITLVAILAD